MKYILIITIILNYLLFNINNEKEKNEKKTETTSNIINLKIIDINTKEELYAVKNIDKYSDFDGNMKITKGDSISLELISYEKLNINNIQSDTIIEMSKVN